MQRWRTALLGAALAMACTGLGAGAAMSQTDANGFMRIAPGAEKWFPYPGQGGRLGLQEAILYGDPSKPGLYVIRLKFPPGLMSRPHSHPDDRLGVVLKGTWWTGTGETFDPASAQPVGVGGFMLHPHGKMHYDGAKGEEVIVQLMGIGPSGKTAAHADQPDFSIQ
ncbi:MAG: hypothetical protein JWO72_2187 [Caulobacteraceae bacterium]|jgi:quercetin dioxygenase-like cupin family protein|nr:hypothetical protein [Caulobacteraceae bacterium]